MDLGRPEPNKIPRPKISDQPQVPKQNKKAKGAKFSISFAFWTQRENFGLSPKGDDSAWYVSLFDGLRGICAHDVDTIQCDPNLKNQLNIHRFDWSRGNMGISISKKEFEDLIPLQYRNSPEYEPFQIQVSTGHGRLIGFYDENNIFQLLLLDPNHNFCLSNYSEYKIRPTQKKLSQFEVMHNLVQAIKEDSLKHCKQTTCPALENVNEVLSSSLGKEFVCLTDVDPQISNILYGDKYKGNIVGLTCDMVDLFVKHVDQSSNN